MATYDFICKKCGKKEEVTQKMDDPFVPSCEQHGQMSKEISAPMIRRGAGVHSIDVGLGVEKFGDLKD